MGSYFSIVAWPVEGCPGNMAGVWDKKLGKARTLIFLPWRRELGRCRFIILGACGGAVVSPKNYTANLSCRPCQLA